MREHKPIDFQTAEQIHTLQEISLGKLMNYLAQHSTFYRKVFSEIGINPDEIKLADLPKIPFTTKDHLAAFNEEFLCIPKNEVADFVTTSGTLSSPVTFYLSANDLERLAYNEAKSFACAGAKAGDIFQLMTTLDKQFMAGLAYYLGARKLKAGVIRMGPATPMSQWESIKRFSPDFLIAVPSFIPKMISYALENNIDYRSSSVKSIICIGEPIRNPDFSWNELGKRIISQWDVQLFSTYASTEMGAAFTECEMGNGGHSRPDLLWVEVVNESGEQVNDGELGEVVITTFGVEGMPLLRYKTGDLCHVHLQKCACGRSSIRLGPVVGRKQQMIKYKGTTLFPPAIFDLLDKMPEVEVYQVEISQSEFGNDEIAILLCADLEEETFVQKLNLLFKSRLRVTPKYRFISKSELMTKVFKVDKRKSEKIIYI